MSGFDFRCKHCKGYYDSIEAWENGSDGCSDCDFIYTGSLRATIDKYKNLHDLAKGRLNKAHEYTDKLEAENKAIKSRIDDLEQTLGIVYFSGDIERHFPETHKMVEEVLKEQSK